MSYLREFADAESSYRVRVDDDDRVAYAYLIDGERESEGEHGIVGDVWLYNVTATPSEPEWRGLGREAASELMPFLNAAAYVRDEQFVRLEDASSVTVDWSSADGDRIAEVAIDGVLHARLRPGAKPGWARLAVIDSPCALPLDPAVRS